MHAALAMAMVGCDDGFVVSAMQQPWIQRLAARRRRREQLCWRCVQRVSCSCASSAWLFCAWLLASVLLPLANSGMLCFELYYELRVASARLSRRLLFVVMRADGTTEVLFGT